MLHFLRKYIIGIMSLLFVTNAYSEIKLLDDGKMEKVTAQAGITIDIEYKLSVGEFAYKDGKSGGSILVQGLKIGGNKNIGAKNNIDDRTYIYNSGFK